MRPIRQIAAAFALAALSLSAVHAQPIALDTRGGGNPEAANGGSFLHVARNGGADNNVNVIMTYLVSEYPAFKSSPMTDNNPNAVIFATPNVTFSTASQWSPFGVSYEEDGWTIYNQNDTVIAGGEAFNVQVQGKTDSIFVHAATVENVSGNHTTIDHPLINGNPNALLSVTPVWQGMESVHYFGVYYNIGTGKWAIFNQDMAAMPVGVTFNVQVLQDPTVDFMHTASVVVSTSKTEIDHPLLNYNSNALIIVTQNWGSIGGIYNDNPVGVEYDNASNKWRIVNIDGSAMPANAKFNVHIASVNSFADGVLVNGGFEAATSNGKNFAAKWNSTAAGAGSKRVCNTYAPKSAATKIFANTGECAFMLKGAAGQTRKITQTTAVSNGTVGGTGELLLWAKASHVTGFKVKVQVKFGDSASTSFKLPGGQLNGTYAWKPISAQLLMPPGSHAVSMKVTISLTGTGKVFIDDVIGMIYNF